LSVSRADTTAGTAVWLITSARWIGGDPAVLQIRPVVANAGAESDRAEAARTNNLFMR
jgi:hypothetical protein